MHRTMEIFFYVNIIFKEILFKFFFFFTKKKHGESINGLIIEKINYDNYYKSHYASRLNKIALVLYVKIYCYARLNCEKKKNKKKL
jgi:hypothetical protein